MIKVNMSVPKEVGSMWKVIYYEYQEFSESWVSQNISA